MIFYFPSGLGDIFKYGAILICIALPLALWKLIEIVIWLIQHVEISFQ